MSYIRILLFLSLLFLGAVEIAAQESCPCENCPGPIQDLELHEYKLNIFNIQNNDLASATQCVSKVGVKFKHQYLGDMTIELESPAGDKVILIGPVTSVLGGSGQTRNTTFDVSFVPLSTIASPEDGFDTKWANELDWSLFGGTRRGSYYPYKGNLEDFDEGRVNGTWTLRIFDQVQERKEEGELLDFYVEFCDAEGLVCDPCLDPEDTPDCIFMVDAGEETVVPDENFCVPIYAKNVAFLKDMEFGMNWDASVLEYTGVNNFKIEFLQESDFNTTEVGTGKLSIDYNHTFDDLGLVVKDSTPIFQVCFKAIGGVGDSSKINIPGVPLAIDVQDVTLMAAAMEGNVKIAVDSTADCVRAIQLCDNSPISVEKSRGPGFQETEAIGCFPDGVEHQAKWYTFDILTSGSLELIIRPKGAASYGFALYKGSCPDSPDSELAACQSGMLVTSNAIGMADNPLESFEESEGTNFQATLTTIEAESYYLLVDNFSDNGIGFDLEFGGTATIGDYTIQARIADPETINCIQPTIQLDATSSTQGPNYIPEWSTDTGEIDITLSDFEPLILKGGNFTLKITDSRTGCIAEKTVFVPTNQDFPAAEAGDGGILECKEPLLTLSSLGSSIGEKFEIEWTSTNGEGNIIGSPTAENISVDAGGIYEVKITNTENKCISRDSVLVQTNFVLPQLTAVDNAISCRTPIAELSASSTTNGVTYEWTAGNLTTPMEGATVSVNDTGIFIITITAPNGCTNIDSVLVKEQRIFPEVEAGATLQLNCDNPLQTLDGTGSSEGAEFIYLWTTEKGRFLQNTDQNSLFPQVEEGGIFQLAVTDTTNGCVSIDSVLIDTSFIAPVLNIVADSILNCYHPQLVIDASNSDSGAIYEFDWFVTEGSKVSGNDTYQLIVEEAGGYFFKIKNIENGCNTTSDILNITADMEAPLASTGEEATLNCTQSERVLDGQNSSKGEEFTYEWRSGNGNFITNTSEITTEVDAAGIYVLKVTNVSNGCETEESVEIFEDFVIPDLSIPKDSALTCRFPSILLTASSTTQNTDFSWILSDGEKVEGAVITTEKEGLFLATVTAANGCTNRDSLQIDTQKDFPKISINEPQTLTCEREVVTINANDSDKGEMFEYSWSTVNGNFVNEAEKITLQPTVSDSGTYLLEVANTETGCVILDSVFVPTSVDRPSIDFLNEPDVLTCAKTKVSIAVSSNAPNPTFQWKQGQTVLSTAAELTVEEPGSYNILVVNPANNCSSRSTILIENDTLRPIADAGETMELNCATGEVILDASKSSQGEAFAYLWTTQNNESVSDSIFARIEQPGFYTLIVFNQKNGCRTFDNIRVTESVENPVADAGKDTIYCQGSEELTFVLGGSNTSNGANYTYQWQDIKGNALGDEREQLVEVIDTFILEVRNMDNNCVVTDTVAVLERPRPTITLSSSGAINCKENEIIYVAQSDFTTTKVQWQGKDNFLTADSILMLTDALLGQQFIAAGTDEITGCVGQSNTITVTSDRLSPLADAGKDAKLNCRDTLFLDGKILSENLDANITWETENGNIVSGENELNPIVDAAGIYVFTIENKNNFCQIADTVRVETDQVLPIVKLGKDTLLTCRAPILTIQPDSLSSGRNFYYEWRNAANKLLADTEVLTVELPDTYQLKVIDSTNLCTNFAKIIVLDSLNPPSIKIDVPAIITCENKEVLVQANVGAQNATYEWTIDNEIGNIIGTNEGTSILVDAAGTYQIEATNTISGCFGIRSIDVKDISQPIGIDGGEDKVLTCYNEASVELIGTIFSDSPNLLYEWTASLANFTSIDTTLTIRTKEPGTFFLSVLDTVSKCQVIDTVRVTENTDSIVYNIGEDLTLDCQKTEARIGDLNDIGTTGYRYTWTTQEGSILTGESEAIATVNQGGLYVIRILNTVNGCTYVDSQSVFASTLLPVVDVGEMKFLTCSETEAIIGGQNTSKGNQFIYEWTTETGAIIAGENTEFATINQSGTYELSVRDSTNQCTQTNRIVIIENKATPQITLPEGLAFSCADETLIITPTTQADIANLKSTWFTNNGMLISAESDFLAEVASPSEYYISVEDTTNNCVTIDTVLVSENRTIPEVAQIADRMLSCSNQAITLSAIGSQAGEGIQYEWLTGQGLTLSNNTTLTLDEPGTYVLKITNIANQCINTDTIRINENFNPPTSADFIIETPSCNGVSNGVIEVRSVQGGTAPYEYVLQESDIRRDPLFTNLMPDNYLITIIDELDCEWDTTIQLNQPALIEATLQASSPELLTGELVILTANTNIPEEAIAEIIWTPMDLFDCLDCQEQTLSLLKNTTIGVEIMDDNGCSATDSIDISVSLAPIPNGITPNGDGVNDFFMIPAIETDPLAYPNSELIIINRWGDEIYRAAPYNNDWNGTGNTGQELPEGTYYFVLRLDVREGETRKGDITILRKN